MKYCLYHTLLAEDRDRIIEIENEPKYFLCDEKQRTELAVTIEGGDILVISPRHVLIGCSERTSVHGVRKLVEYLFAKDIVTIASVVNLPKKRGTMHLDTVVTPIRRDLWVVYPRLLGTEKGGTANGKIDLSDFGDKAEALLREEVECVQFQHKGGGHIHEESFGSMERLLEAISFQEFHEKNVGFVFCGAGVFPYTEREQWADACNLLALREGVVLGYDRNEMTKECFSDNGFEVTYAEELLGKIRKAWQEKQGEDDIKKLVTKEAGKDTLILLPSSELSRARGGSHCLSMPWIREPVDAAERE